MTKHLLDIDDLGPEGLKEVLDLAGKADPGRPLQGKGAALVFQHPSARTRNSMEMAVVQLGGHPVYITDAEVGIGTRESPADVVRTLASYHALVAARVKDHSLLAAMAEASPVPVVNMLSDAAHPLQALADLLTLRDELGRLEGVQLAYVGDVNNVARSLAIACSMVGVSVRLAAPEGFQATDEELAAWSALGAPVTQTASAAEAVAGVDAVYTDVWISMGQEEESVYRKQTFAPYQVNEDLMAKAADGAIFLHCLPAKRGFEVTDGVVDAPASRVWRQAANRMHSARGALAWLMGA